MIPEPLYQVIDFNIDRYLNPFIPRNCTHLLPKPISHFLGYRSKAPKEPPALVRWILTIIATVGGLLAVGGVLNYATSFQAWNPPIMIASLGAAAVLEYNAIGVPFSQPRNAIIGNTLSAIMGVGFAKLFQLSPGFWEKYMWIASTIACAAASLVMSATNTLYPPGGATAVLACVDKQIIDLGWRYPGLVIVATSLMIAVALLLNNTLRRYPLFWWTPEEVGSKLHRKEKKEETRDEKEESKSEDSDLEKGEQPPSLSIEKIYDSDASDRERSDSGQSESTLAPVPSRDVEFLPGLEAIHIAPYMIRMPPQLDLTEAESEMLRGLMSRLRTQVAQNQI